MARARSIASCFCSISCCCWAAPRAALATSGGVGAACAEANAGRQQLAIVKIVRFTNNFTLVFVNEIDSGYRVYGVMNVELSLILEVGG